MQPQKLIEKAIAPWETLAKQQRTIIENMLAHASKMSGMNFTDNEKYLDMAETYKEISKNLLTHPTSVLQMNAWIMKEHMKLWQNSLSYMTGKRPEQVIVPEAGDRRFNHEDWEKNPYFNYVKQVYLIQAKAILDLVEDPTFGEEDKHEYLKFFTRQLVNALAPTNFLFSNPEALRKTISTGGLNLHEGLKNYLADRKNDPQGVNVAMTDNSAFEVGKNVAATPGKVIFQNEMMQLIQYTPTTSKVYKTPLLIIPPWINKYYILDLKPENSMVKWLVEQGFTTFIISWVNPGKEEGDKTWEDYLASGPLAAMDAIEKATGEREVNTIGYCIGGTLQATALAYLAAKNDNRVKSATYFTTLLDFTDPGALGVFINEKLIEDLDRRYQTTKVFDGRSMSLTFNLLRENDLYWPFYITNYLKGEKPALYDLLYWNTDNTNMPGKMHTFYLRNMYLENKLKEPSGITLNGVKIDLKKIKTPVYFLSAIQDHVAKWKTTFLGTELHSGDVTFVLSGSGHTAGVVNPPHAKKYGHWTNPNIKTDADTWYQGATKHEGSWWPNWKEWVLKHGAEEVDAREPGAGELKTLEDAPGSYVRVRVKDLV